MAAFGGGLLVGLAVTPLVVHHLGPVGWGDYGKVASLQFIMATLTEGGLGQMGLRELSVGDPASHKLLMRDLIGLRLSLTFLGALLALAFGIAAGWGNVVVAGIAITGIGSIVANLQVTLALPLGASLRLGWMALNDFVPQFTSALVMFVLVLAGASLLPFYTAPLAAWTSALVLTIYVLRREVPLRPSISPSRWRTLLSQTFIYAVATSTTAAYFRIALVATALLSTGEETGYYSLAFRILELTTVVPWLLVGSSFPILIRSAWSDSARLRYALQRLFEGSLILGGWFALCLVVGAPFAIHVLEGGGNAFAPSVPVLRILGGAIAATFLIATFSYTLLSLQMFRQLVALNLSVVLLAFVLSPLLISPYGARGAAIVTVTLEVILCLGYAVALFHARPDLRPSLAGIERIMLALALAFAASEVLADHPVLGVTAGTVVLAAALLAFRAVPPELIDVARDVARGFSGAVGRGRRSE